MRVSIGFMILGIINVNAKLLNDNDKRCRSLTIFSKTLTSFAEIALLLIKNSIFAFRTWLMYETYIAHIRNLNNREIKTKEYE